MRRYLEQIACVLRPGSVVNTDGALRCFATFLAETTPGVTGLAQITRAHVEAFKPWLAARQRPVSTDRQRSISITVTRTNPGRCLVCVSTMSAVAPLTLRN